MRTRSLAIAAASCAVVLGGCGGNDDAAMPVSGGDAVVTGREEATRADEPAGEPRKAATIVLRGSEFGSMLFDSAKQAIYVFENDRPNETACYGECAEAWPPVYTEGRPKAGRGVDPSLLGTVERRDGRIQVTYAGKPLYFYAHESPGEVRCHNVDLNGGLWWVVGPNGEPRPA
jgi:predicted lipoprotein with Yx(FWY)xxD motif